LSLLKDKRDYTRKKACIMAEGQQTDKQLTHYRIKRERLPEPP
jgi:hypothetical protein